MDKNKRKSTVCFLSPNREPAAAQKLRVHTKECSDLLFRRHSSATSAVVHKTTKETSAA